MVVSKYVFPINDKHVNGVLEMPWFTTQMERKKKQEKRGGEGRGAKGICILRDSDSSTEMGWTSWASADLPICLSHSTYFCKFKLGKLNTDGCKKQPVTALHDLLSSKPYTLLHILLHLVIA